MNICHSFHDDEVGVKSRVTRNHVTLPKTSILEVVMQGDETRQHICII